MVLKALSCIEVAICTRLTAMPARKPIASSGAASQKAASKVWRMMSTTGFRGHQ